MPDKRSRLGVNWRQAAGEALLIFLGVTVALLGQAWWENRGDRELERHLLDGIRTDLARDSADAASAILAASARIAGADRLLAHLGDPDAGVIRPVPWEPLPGSIVLASSEVLEGALAIYASEEILPQRALHMIVATASMQRLDLSDSSFGEATASGQLNVIRDTPLRTAIADYYFTTGRFGSTIDNRVEQHWLHFLEVLASAGLSAAGGDADDRILTSLWANETLRAEIKNVRAFAVTQVGALTDVLTSAEALIMSLDQHRSR